MRSPAVLVGGAVLVVLLVGLVIGLFLSSDDPDDDVLTPVAPTAATTAVATPTAATTAVATPTAATPAAATPAAATPTATTPTAARITVRHDPILALIWTTPRGVVFEEVGESVTLAVQARYSDGTDHVLPDQPGQAVVFDSSDPSVATVDSAGLITAVAPGGVDILVEYQGVRTEVPVIVYGPYVHVPPYDPQRVVELVPGVDIVVNRVIVHPATDEYAGSIVRQIAADHGGQLIAEWPNLVLFALEFPITSPGELEEKVLALDVDARVAAVELDVLYTASHYHDSPGFATSLSLLRDAWSLLVPALPSMNHVSVAVMDANLSLDHEDENIQAVIDAEFNDARIRRARTREISGYSHGLSVASIIAGRGKIPGVIEGVNRAAGVQDATPYSLHFYDIGTRADFDAVDDWVSLISAFEHVKPHEEHVSVINLSMGYLCRTPRLDSRVLIDIVCHYPGAGPQKQVYDKAPGILFVVAAGNDNWHAGDSRPGAWSLESENILTVGALDHYAWLESGYQESSVNRMCIEGKNGWKGSNYGPEVSIAAEGASVYALYTDYTETSYGYKPQAGTSVSAPIVSGVAALILSVMPEATPAQIRDILMDTARLITVDERKRDNCGNPPPSTWRQLDARAAVSHVLNMLVGAEFSCCELNSPAIDRLVDLSFDLTNTGSIDWSFSVNVTATSPGGSEVTVLPEADGTGGHSHVVELAAGLTQPLGFELPIDERGEWTIRMRVTRDPFARSRLGLWCSNIIDDQDCLDDIEFTINTGSSTFTMAPAPASTPPPTPTPSVSAGRFHTCAVKAEGLVVCWGDDEEGQASPPSGEFLSVSAGWAHTCGIRTDRAVECWGSDEDGQSSAPAGEFRSVSAGRWHTCGVRTDGRAECWGGGEPFHLTSIPRGLRSGLSSVSATEFQSCGVRQDGLIGCWGQGAPSPRFLFFTEVSAGGGHSCGIRTNGTVACWGNNDQGQATPPAGTFTSISASMDGRRTCGVRTDGSATCWGAGIRLGIVLPEHRMPVLLEPDGRFSTISAGDQHVCGTRPGGDVVCWGRNRRGQAMPPGVPLASISAGDRHECGLRVDGSVACYAHGGSDFERTDIPPGSFASLSAGHSHNCALKADGSLTCWGWNPYGQATTPGGTFAAIDLAWNHSCGLREGGEIECWGNVNRTPPGGPFTALATSANGDGCGLRPDGSAECWGEHVSEENGPPDETFTSLAVGWGHACGIKTDGTVACWGNLNTSGQASPPSGRFEAISLGNWHSCGLREAGEIECWGENGLGQAEAPDGTFISISTHTDRTCALREDGDSYVCWGHQ